jgi:hypothetical protein
MDGHRTGLPEHIHDQQPRRPTFFGSISIIVPQLILDESLKDKLQIEAGKDGHNK